MAVTVGTRDRIVTATAELFRRRGYNGTSLKDISSAAAAPIGSLYHFFPGGKVELAEAVIAETGAAYQQLFELMAGDGPDIAEAIRLFFEGAAGVLEQTDFIDLCPIGTVAREVASASEPLRSASAAVFEKWRRAAAERLQHAGLPPDDAAAVAGTVVATLEGGFILARAARDTTVLRVSGEHMRRLINLYLRQSRGERPG